MNEQTKNLFKPKIMFTMLLFKVYIPNHNILRLFDVLPNFIFTTSETMCDC